TPQCGREARRQSLREAGRRYQSTRDGRFAHAARQRRYIVRLRKVTHQSSPTTADAARVPPAPDHSALMAKLGSGAEETADVQSVDGNRARAEMDSGAGNRRNTDNTAHGPTPGRAPAPES